jgi:prophage regulatory protein
MPITILRLPAVQSQRGEAKATVYLRIKQGLFTKPVKLGGRTSGWPETEVAVINAARIAGKSDEEIRALVKELHAARTSTGKVGE